MWQAPVTDGGTWEGYPQPYLSRSQRNHSQASVASSCTLPLYSPGSETHANITEDPPVLDISESCIRDSVEPADDVLMAVEKPEQSLDDAIYTVEHSSGLGGVPDSLYDNMAMSEVSQELGRGGTEEEMVQPISVMRKRRCVACR